MTMSTNIYAKPVAPYAPPLGFGIAVALATHARPFVRKVIDASKAGAKAAKQDWIKD